MQPRRTEKLLNIFSFSDAKRAPRRSVDTTIKGELRETTATVTMAIKNTSRGGC